MSARPVVTTDRLPEGRGCVNDIATLALDVPLFPVDRAMQLGSLAEARAACAVRIGWAAIFLKAYALVAREMPALRSWLCGRLRQRIATSSKSVATLAVNRADAGADRLFFARLTHPDATPLPLLQASIDRFLNQPVDRVFARQLQLEAVPTWLRRTILRWNMHSASPKRATRIGTFSLSTLAGFSATNRFHPTLCTTSLSYGPLEPDGRCLVTVIADHRVLDGAGVAKALARLEELLATEIVAELRTARPAPAEAAA
ncbi:MAG: hypothetical protein ACKO6E_00750 [Planctomycetota bacterium]